MTSHTWDGLPLTPGVNVDAIDRAAGIESAKALGYDDGEALMVVDYALARHARGEEDGAQRTWLRQFPTDLTSWYVILASAMAAHPANTAPTP